MGQGDGDQQDLQQKAEGWFKGVKDKVQNSDWLNKARDEVTRQGRDIADGLQRQGQGIADDVNRKVQNKDWTGLAGDAAKVIGKGGIGDALGGGTVGNIVGGAMFPQAAIAKLGVETIGGVVANRQAKALLEDPVSLGDKLSNSFDGLDGDKDKFIVGTELKEKSGGIGGLLDSNRGIMPILDKGYSKFAAFDGKDPDKGISKDDIELFKTVQSKDAIDQAISDKAATWGTRGAIAGGVAGLVFGGLKGGLVRGGAITLGLAAVAGGAAYLAERRMAGSYYETKQKEAGELVNWLKNEL